MDNQVVLFDTSGEGKFNFPFKLKGHDCLIYNISEDDFILRIDNRTFGQWMNDERSGKLKKKKEEQKKKEQKKIDEYNKRAMQYNGRDYKEGQEYKIIEKQKEKEREKEKRKREINDPVGFKDELLKPSDIGMIKFNLEHAKMKQDGGKNISEFYQSNNAQGGNQNSQNNQSKQNDVNDIFAIIGGNAGNNNNNNNFNNNYKYNNKRLSRSRSKDKGPNIKNYNNYSKNNYKN